MLDGKSPRKEVKVPEQGTAAAAAQKGPSTPVGGAGGAAAAAPTDDVTQRPSRQPSRGGRSRALPGRSLGRIMEASPAPVPDSVSALLCPSSPFPFSSCPLQLAAWPASAGRARARGGVRPARLLVLLPSRVLRTHLLVPAAAAVSLGRVPPPLQASYGVGSGGLPKGERWGGAAGGRPLARLQGKGRPYTRKARETPQRGLG